ncbi:MAG: peptide chain release factor 2 [Candidatus Omnitrophica bacterium]|nr:peptide chain release factor 2 [Candidatus Omnitrophota bacterium]
MFDPDKKKSKIKELEGRIAEQGFWNDRTRANATLKELKSLKQSVDPFLSLLSKLKETEEFLEITDANDEPSLRHLGEELSAVQKKLDKFEFNCLLGEEGDSLNAILSINAGAGGTESCDWAGMLFRMYTKWSDSKGYAIERVDYLAGEEAGIKSVTFVIKGEFAYGYLKGERGVHRLVRISPFDANKRRHTSFASVDVVPEINEEIKVDIKPDELKIDTYRAGGRGGQHVNVTDSAVRITHLPTGIIAQCQNERSQYKNKSTAMKVLKSRIYEMELKKKKSELEKKQSEKKRIEWGSQIRSYVLHPYSMVKDHRTGCETSNSGSVLDGDLEGFIEAYLRYDKKK